MRYYFAKVLSATIVVIFTSTNFSIAQENTANSIYHVTVEPKNSCEQYNKAEVTKNVDLFIHKLFSRNKPSIADALYFIGSEAASESFLEAEYDLGVTGCLQKWRAKDWDILSESQISSCGDFTSETNKSLYYKQLRLKTGLIKKYSIEKITFLKSDSNWIHYKILVVFKKPGNSKKSSLEIAHSSNKCIDDGGWMQVITLNGKLQSLN